MSTFESLARRMTSGSSWRQVSTAVALGLLVMSGCSSFTEACTSELSWRLTPATQALRVGESFKPEMVLLSCGGKEQLTDTITWSTEDTRIVAVDRLSGRVSALTVGQAVVKATAQYYGVSDDVTVTVIAQ